uniref:Uncharacterized protein n=1 Tax=Knipowitschia caucasica TaxID=637954 RepID=A0AAV2MD64_KNICA
MRRLAHSLPEIHKKKKKKKKTEHFVPKRNVIHDRACFYKRVQKPGESVEAFVPREEHIRDRIVVGIMDKELSRKLQLMSDLTLTLTIQNVRQSEEVAAQVCLQGDTTAAVQEVRSKGIEESARHGQLFRLETDHRPLVPLINSQSLDNVPLRCQRLLMRLMRHKLEAVYMPGAEAHPTKGATHLNSFARSTLEKNRTGSLSTPCTTTGVSPAELLMGRKIRTNLPTLEKNLNPKWPNKKMVLKKDAVEKARQAFYFNRRHGVRPLPPLRPGDAVVAKLDQDKAWVTPATVSSEGVTPRLYILKTPQGVMFRRNRRHLRTDYSAPIDIAPLPQPTETAVAAPIQPTAPTETCTPTNSHSPVCTRSGRVC